MDASQHYSDADYAETESLVARLISEDDVADLSREGDPLDVNEFTESMWQERTVTGRFIRKLVLKEQSSHARDHVRIQGLRVLGDIDLEGADVPTILSVTRCFIDGRIILVDAKARRIGLYQSGIAGDVLAAGTTAGGGIEITESKLKGTIDLRMGQVEGQLDLRGSRIGAPGSTALDARSATVKGSVRLDDCTIDGRVDLHGINIHGLLQCEGCSITGSTNASSHVPRGLTTGKSSAWPDARTNCFARSRTSSSVRV